MVAGRYRLVQSIGQGGMGRVWRAADEMLDRQVAVKEMRMDGVDAEDSGTRRERTLREARATARIDHPHVVRVYDVVDEGERLWIVMELVAGRSLERIIAEDGPLGPRDTARIGLGLLAALRQVHARGVLHRDIKPANVLVEEGEVRRTVLTDFGIAAIQDAKALTVVGMLVGSPDYMAPERVSGRPQGPPSDLWSLGATLCAALAGHSPFARATTLATLHAVLYERPDIPPAAGPLREVLTALLHKDPGARPTLDTLCSTLTPVAHPPPPPTMPALPAPAPGPGRPGAVDPAGGDAERPGARGADPREPSRPGAAGDDRPDPATTDEHRPPEDPGGPVTTTPHTARGRPGPGNDGRSGPGSTPAPPGTGPGPAPGGGSAGVLRDPGGVGGSRGGSGPGPAQGGGSGGVPDGPGAPGGGRDDFARARTEERPLPEHPRRPGGAAGRRRLVAAAAAGVAAVAVAVVLVTESGEAGHGARARASATAPSGTAPPTVEGTSRPATLPPGARREAGGFAWSPPDGWRRNVRTGAEIHYTSPDGSQELAAKSSLARGDLLRTWQTSERNAHQGRDYVKIRLEETTFRGHPAVVWEYTFTLDGLPWHARLLGFDVGGTSYQINTWYRPGTEAAALATYEEVKRGFTVL
ncbi:protein kinase domain-containing protein [Streptomyces sp. enrichment culture]|uniref:serine/threonine-protein kinase n=1 Tax=Streptomyces sp. enrichment culture TaxID=1795815 RepID=UPI003F55E11C